MDQVEITYLHSKINVKENLLEEQTIFNWLVENGQANEDNLDYVLEQYL